MRELVLGNTNLVVSYDSKLNIRDLYYPYIGHENHLENNKNRIGFWVSGKFSWVDEEWKKEFKYDKDSLVANVQAESDYLNIVYSERAAVYYKKNIYLKEIRIKNISNQEKDVRIFFHHILKIYGETKNSTALFDPLSNSVIHYKRNRYFLFNGGSPDTGAIYEYNIDTMDVGAEGNYKDAEDGKLEMNAVGHGRVNSMISLRGTIMPDEEKVYYYWFCAGKNFKEVHDLNDFVVNNGLGNLIDETKIYWKNWINKRALNFGNISEEVIDEYKKSLLLIKSHINENGAVISSVNYEHLQYYRDTYNYIWPRDAAFAAMAIDEAGYTEMGRSIFRFLDKIITEQGFFWNKYHPDGALSSTWHPWVSKGKLQLPIQEDQTAIVLIALYRHYKISMDIEFIEEVYENLVKRIIIFLTDYINEIIGLPIESYDIWENKRGIHLYTTASVYEALVCGKEIMNYFGEVKIIENIDRVLLLLEKNIEKYFVDTEMGIYASTLKKNEKGEIVIHTLYDSCVLYTLFFREFSRKFPIISSTIEQNIEKLQVRTTVGGIARYENDTYHQLTRDIKSIPGNPWIAQTLLKGYYYIEKGELDKGYNVIKEIQTRANKAGILAEQMHPYSGDPISVMPYVLSHAFYVLTVNNYLRKNGTKII